MQISGKKRSELYNSFAEQIMNLRIEIRQDKYLSNSDNIDARLFKLEQQIWSNIKMVLKI